MSTSNSATLPSGTSNPNQNPSDDTTLIDGVPVTTRQVVVSGSVLGTKVDVPVVTSDMAGADGIAVIPIVASSDSKPITATLSVDVGLSASVVHVEAIKSQGVFIDMLGSTFAPAAPVDDRAKFAVELTKVISENSDGVTLGSYLVSTSAKPPVDAIFKLGILDSASILDASHTASGTKVTLDSTGGFAAILGKADVTLKGSGTVVGDSASQTLAAYAGDVVKLLAGGGADKLSFMSAPKTPLGSATDHASALAAPTVATLDGGLGDDTAAFSGARSDYDVALHNGYAVVASKAAPDAKALVVNVEHLQFSDTTIALGQAAAQETLAALFQTVLGRQADVYGFEYWADRHDAGASWGAIALGMIASNESAAHQSFDGTAAHDIGVLYQALFNRQADAAGLAYWQNAMSHGTSLEQVATALVDSVEMVGHQRLPADWDFQV